MVKDPVAAGYRVGAGSFGWDGAYGTHFWVDPEEEIHARLLVHRRQSLARTGASNTGGAVVPRNWRCAMKVSFHEGGRRLLLVGACLLVGVVLADGQAVPETRVDIDELKAAIDSGATMLLIDVREDYEVESGSMPGSIHIPLGQLEGRLSDIPKDVRLVFF